MTEATCRPPESQFLTNSPANFIQHRMFSFDGRIGRLRFSSYLFTVFLAFIICKVAVFFATAVMSSTLNLIFNLIFLLPVFIIFSRRLNDLNRSGYWAILTLAPIFNLLLLAVLYLFPGSKKNNLYGITTPANNTGLYITGILLPVLFFSAAAYLAYLTFEDLETVTGLARLLIDT